MSGVEVFEIMFYIYNLVLHGPLFIVNCFIVLKELTLERWQLLSNNFAKGSKQGKDDLSLGYSDAKRGLEDFWWFLNPFTWVDLFWYFLFGWDLKDTFIENPDDEEHYLGQRVGL